MTKTLRLTQTFFAFAVCGAMSLSDDRTFAQGTGQTAHDHSGHGHADHGHSEHEHADHGHSDHGHAGEGLAFYLPEWNSMHFDDANKAAQHAATLKQLGCEVKQGSHAGHIDVTFRAAMWKELKVKDHNMAQQWATWLSQSGFDVSHSHADPAYFSGPEAVEFRMLNWKKTHGNGAANEQQFVTALRQIGCEVRLNSHDGHSDIAYRAPTWRAVHLADPMAAEQLIGWLNQNGFETHHSR